MSHSKVFTDGQLAALVAKRSEGAEYQIIADFLLTQYGLACSAEAVRRAYNSYKHLFETAKGPGAIKMLKESARTKRQNSQVAKENRTILQALNDQADMLEQIREVIKEIPKVRASAKKPPKPNGKPDMTVEVLVSDVHVGKKTDTFGLEVCRTRLRHFATVVVQEIARKQVHYNVERIILALLGDLIENALMHGRESAMSCEFGNPEQVRYAIEMIYHEILVPLAALGIPVDVVCIAGNHDREEERPTFNQPGKNSLCWIIYHTLKLLCDRSGMAHLTWTIPDGVYTALEIYGDHILYEHGDRIKGGNDKRSFAANLVKRSGQLGVVLKGMRVGHWHEFACLDNGQVIVNASVPGQDSYADVNGYNSRPGQTVVFYVRTNNRDNAFFHAFLVQLP